METIRKEIRNMAKVKQTSTKDTKKSLRPALMPEARENRAIALAMDLVEQRLMDGTASSQETTHFLKLGSVKNKLEIEKLKAENDLIHAKAEMVRAQKNNEEMFKDAIAAMKEYSGNGTTEDDIEDEY
jgi:hypothetical protein